jgi:ParB family chromosome partitioning protein
MINPEPRPEKAAKPVPPLQDANVHEAQDMLQRRLGLKVRIEDKSGKGRVIIEYARLEDFDAILAALGDS